MEQFVENEQDIIFTDPATILALIQSCDRGNIDTALKDPTTLTIISKYKQYQDMSHKGHLNKTAVFQLSFIKNVQFAFMLLYSIKVNDFKLVHECNGDITDLFFMYGGPNYGS